MSELKHTVNVTVEYFSGEDDGSYYVASSDDLMFTTEGETFEQLLENIRECLVLGLRDTDSILEYGVAPDARVKIIMELPENYAETA